MYVASFTKGMQTCSEESRNQKREVAERLGRTGINFT